MQLNKLTLVLLLKKVNIYLLKYYSNIQEQMKKKCGMVVLKCPRFFYKCVLNSRTRIRHVTSDFARRESDRQKKGEGNGDS